MRRIIAIVSAVMLLLVWAVVPRAQFGVGRSRVSPHESTKATISGANLSIVYGRPSMRGRKIFGSLVPYDEIWCPGADEATMLTTSRPLQFGDVRLMAGEYSLWILPTATTWTLIFNSEAHTFHTRHDSSRDVGRVRLQKASVATPVEQLTFMIENSATGQGGNIAMTWATTRVAAPFVVLAK
jgi:hypothetical protein